MRIINYILICSALISQSCNGQIAPKKEIFNKEFNWKITIPEGFENVNAVEWAKMQNKGKEAIEKTYGGEVENKTKVIFAFRADKFNYFESNWQPYDVSKDGDYLESCKKINQILFDTFKNQMPGAKLDSLSSEQTIDGLKFNKFKMVINFPNNMVMDFIMFNRLFDKKEFTVSIIGIDKKKTELLLEAWKNSKFIKE
ncbi:hypothetical protein [Pedobacter gandavensis]|uniref:hypothetical protein n=1 Tax=Pedobacter gandavensis TaxID=2679963 RepID=UPI00292D8B13|nr:hypothetical protein [Pedobacter gandavensis]